jgi:hypothetical protein
MQVQAMAVGRQLQNLRANDGSVVSTEMQSKTQTYFSVA